MKFTMDGGLSAYDYKAEEDEVEDINYKAIAGGPILLAPFAHLAAHLVTPKQLGF